MIDTKHTPRSAELESISDELAIEIASVRRINRSVCSPRYVTLPCVDCLPSTRREKVDITLVQLIPSGELVGLKCMKKLIFVNSSIAFALSVIAGEWRIQCGKLSILGICQIEVESAQMMSTSPKIMNLRLSIRMKARRTAL